MNPHDDFVKWFKQATEKEKLEFFFNMDADELDEWLMWFRDGICISKPYYVFKSAHDIANAIRYCKYRMN